MLLGREAPAAVAHVLPATGAPPEAAATLLRTPEPGPGPGRRVLTFDLETRRAAAEVGGWRYIERLGLALGVVHDESTGTFTTYDEAEAAALVAHLRTADLVVGFNVLRFDYRVLSPYTSEPLERLPTFDLMVELRRVVRRRLSLANLGQATFGRGKSADGLQSLEWVRAGRLAEVEAYCRDDVALTRDLFRHGIERGWLAFEIDGRVLRTPDLGWDLDEIVRQEARRRAARVRGAQPSLFAPLPPKPTW
jgi:DEAD/DEAH box helicase domain-containing protein